MAISKIFKTDAALLPAVAGTVITGIGLHLAGHGGGHGTCPCHNWAVAHVIFSIVFLILVCIHVRQHWSWYKNFLRPSKKSRVPTAVLTLAVAEEAVTGIALLAFINVRGSEWGHIHWIVGLILTVFAIGHIVKRIKTLMKGLKIF